MQPIMVTVDSHLEHLPGKAPVVELVPQPLPRAADEFQTRSVDFVTRFIPSFGTHGAEYLQNMRVLVVAKVDRLCEATPQAGVRIKKELHFFWISCDNHQDFAAMILHERNEFFDRSVTEVPPRRIGWGKGVRLINEKYAAKSFSELLVGLLFGIAVVGPNEMLTPDLMHS